MLEKRYMILDVYGNTLARGMAFDMAICFIEGFMHKFYNEPLDLTIKEEPRCELDGETVVTKIPF